MRLNLHKWLLAAAFLITAAVYWPGLSGGYLFDDYPNIVDNTGVQPHDASLPSLVRAALSSPSSEFKRPLASLSFAANYLATRLDPYWMKLTNLVIHLMNGFLVFVLAAALLAAVRDAGGGPLPGGVTESDGRTAALIAAGWMLLPINLTGVLYVVQRMESMANLFVLVGLIGYIAGRRRMLRAAASPRAAPDAPSRTRAPAGGGGFLLCAASITIPTALGLLAKETAVMLPLYAALSEWAVFGLRAYGGKLERRILAMFVAFLVLPMIVGLAWLLPGLMNPAAWATRDFDMETRLLSEARIVVDYIAWTLLPTPGALSFYHDDFPISTGLLQPWTTLASIAVLAGLVALALWLRPRRPLAALGIAWFLGCQLLTGTVVPLELIYEHRNYFASIGLLLAVVPMLGVSRAKPFALPRQVLLGGLLLCWTALTGLTAYAWGDPLRLAADLAARAPLSPRAQYELGRTYIIYSRYAPDSPFTRLAYAPLERSMRLPDSSILPEQALIFMNARMRLPSKDIWWDSLIAKLKARKTTVQDESSLGALTECARAGECDLPKQRMIEAYHAALSHPRPSARLLAMYGDYAWNVLNDHSLGERMTDEAVKAAPTEAAYRITLVKMLAAQGRRSDAVAALRGLQALNIGGSLDTSLGELRALPGMQ